MVDRARMDLGDLEARWLDGNAGSVSLESGWERYDGFGRRVAVRKVVRCRITVCPRPMPRVSTVEIACGSRAVLYHFPTFVATPAGKCSRQVLSLSWQWKTGRSMEAAGLSIGSMAIKGVRWTSSVPPLTDAFGSVRHYPSSVSPDPGD